MEFEVISRIASRISARVRKSTGFDDAVRKDMVEKILELITFKYDDQEKPSSRRRGIRYQPVSEDEMKRERVENMNWLYHSKISNEGMGKFIKGELEKRVEKYNSIKDSMEKSQYFFENPLTAIRIKDELNSKAGLEKGDDKKKHTGPKQVNMGFWSSEKINEMYPAEEGVPGDLGGYISLANNPAKLNIEIRHAQSALNQYLRDFYGVGQRPSLYCSSGREDKEEDDRMKKLEVIIKSEMEKLKKGSYEPIDEIREKLYATKKFVPGISTNFILSWMNSTNNNHELLRPMKYGDVKLKDDTRIEPKGGKTTAASNSSVKSISARAHKFWSELSLHNV